MMINRQYQNGPPAKDVDGCDSIELLQRSETELTAATWGCCKTERSGKACGHDQVFYFIGGAGEMKLEEGDCAIEQGNLFYVPAGVDHQLICTGEESLCFILFSIHTPSGVKALKTKFFQNPDQGQVYEFGSNTTTLLLERSESNKVELALIRWREGKRGAVAAHKDKEQTFFVLSGKGQVTVDGHTESVLPGHLVFVPRNTPHTTEALEGELVYICLNSLVNPADESFDSMYKRIIPGRMERWKKGIDEVGE